MDKPRLLLSMAKVNRRMVLQVTRRTHLLNHHMSNRAKVMVNRLKHLPMDHHLTVDSNTVSSLRMTKTKSKANSEFTRPISRSKTKY
jgi:hypothetical protein